MQSELAHQLRQWLHQQHQVCPGTVTSRTDIYCGCEAQGHGCGDSSTSHGDRTRLHPSGTGSPKMMAQAPCPCSEDPSGTRADPHLHWHKLTPSYACGQCHVRLVAGSETILGLHPEITPGAQPGGLGAAQGRGARCAAPTQRAVALLLSLRPCGASPAAAAVSASPCRQRTPPLPAAAPGACGPSAPRQHGPLPARPLPPSSPSPGFGWNVAFCSHSFQLLHVWLCPGCYSVIWRDEVWHFPCSAVKHRAASRHPQTWLPLVPYGPSVRCHGHCAKHPLALAALSSVDVPPRSSHRFLAGLLSASNKLIPCLGEGFNSFGQTRSSLHEAKATCIRIPTHSVFIN